MRLASMALTLPSRFTSPAPTVGTGSPAPKAGSVFPGMISGA